MRRRLPARARQSGRQRGSKKPAIEDVITAKTSIFSPSMFSATLEEVMTMQSTSFPDRKLPWIQTTLSDQVGVGARACVCLRACV